MPDGVPRKIVFSGIPSQISEAQSLIQAIIYKSNTTTDSSKSNVIVTKEMDCPQDKVGVVIGSKGNYIFIYFIMYKIESLII
jgi:hypothetical protein